MPGVNGHVALVTGGSRGIGRGISLRLARGGAKIAVNYYQNENAAQETLDQIRSFRGEGITIRADVSKKDEVR
jgi:3-oxoacyl-[acyl-carrier protein] reductase